jgi:curved DNA-binding protein CbpA
MRESATYYDILRVGHEAAPERVRTAYRKLAQRFHPDKLPGNADAVRVMVMLNEAYDVLSDPDRRASYDRRIAEEKAGAKRALRRAVTAIEVPTAAWPWYLLFATLAYTAGTVGTVAYKALVPGVAVAVAAPATQETGASAPRHAAVKSPAPAPN